MGGKKDQSGGAWLPANQQLFRSDAGISVPQFDLQDVHPLIGARRVTQVWVDAKRYIILGTALAPGDSSNLGEYVVLAPKEFLAQSQAYSERTRANPAGIRQCPSIADGCFQRKRGVIIDRRISPSSIVIAGSPSFALGGVRSNDSVTGRCAKVGGFSPATMSPT
jgi:hypothetical protein